MQKQRQYNNTFTILCMGLLIFALMGHHVFAQEAKKEESTPVFSTWDGFEPDKCAAIWLIQRFIEPNATIKFFPTGEPITVGIPFDTPDAKFRRYAQKSTYETLLDHYKITDERLLYIGRVIHDIEINIWERKVMHEAPHVQKTIADILSETEGEKQIIQKSNDFFNTLYRDITTYTIKK